MHTTSSYENSGSKVAKIALITLLHAGVALALLSMRVTVPTTHGDPGPIILKPTPKITPPDPPPTEAAPPTTALPPIYVPPTNITQSPPAPPTLTTTTTLPTEPVPAVVGPALISAKVTPAVAKVVESQPFRVAQTGNCAAPSYPPNSARNGDSGTVGLALLIAPDGRVSDARVTSTSGFRELDRAAIAALSLCTFRPASTNGVPESAWGKIAYVWSLEQ